MGPKATDLLLTEHAFPRAFGTEFHLSTEVAFVVAGHADAIQAGFAVSHALIAAFFAVRVVAQVAFPTTGTAHVDSAVLALADFFLCFAGFARSVIVRVGPLFSAVAVHVFSAAIVLFVVFV